MILRQSMNFRVLVACPCIFMRKVPPGDYCMFSLYNLMHSKSMQRDEATPRSAHKSFDAGPGTRLECRHRVFVGIEKTLWKRYPRSIAHDFPIAPSPRLVLWFLSQTDVPVIISVITYRPMLPFLKPE